MAYYRRSTRRVSRRRGQRTLSNYQIATRTGARSQAKQIYALKKRINYIQRRTKPEIVTIRRGIDPLVTQSDYNNFLWLAGTGSQTSNWIGPQLGSAGDTVDNPVSTAAPNNFARLLTFKLYGNIQYTAPTEASLPVTFRIVVVQTRATRSQDLNGADIFSDAGNAFQFVYGPLQTGLARTVKVLSDKRYVLTWQRPSITIKTNIRYLLPFYRDAASSTSQASSETIPKGAIYVFWSRYSLGDATTAGTTVNMMHKLAYTDA